MPPHLTRDARLSVIRRPASPTGQRSAAAGSPKYKDTRELKQQKGNAGVSVQQRHAHPGYRTVSSDHGLGRGPCICRRPHSNESRARPAIGTHKHG